MAERIYLLWIDFYQALISTLPMLTTPTSQKPPPMNTQQQMLHAQQQILGDIILSNAGERDILGEALHTNGADLNIVDAVRRVGPRCMHVCGVHYIVVYL